MFRKTACSILVMALSGCVSNGDNFGSALNKVDDALAPLDNLAAGLDPNAAQETSMPAQKETWTPTEKKIVRLSKIVLEYMLEQSNNSAYQCYKARL